jgi:hypothetical protein
MADITMCHGIGCPQKGKCRRFTALADKYQGWFMDVPWKDDHCDYFIPFTKTTSQDNPILLESRSVMDDND